MLLIVKNFIQRSYCRTFDLKHINKSIFLISTLKGDSQSLLKSGKLVKKRGASFFGRWRLEALLNIIFFSFLYEIRSPLDLVGMKRYFMHKKGIAEKALMNLQRYTNLETEHLKAIIQQFEKSYLIRKAIIQKTEKTLVRTVLVHDLEEALIKGITPQHVLKGYSGSWVLRDKNYVKRAIFKPFDEEMGAPNNPRGDRLRGVLGSTAIRKGIRSGESYLREVAVYKISHYLGFSVVPETVVASFSNDYFFGIRRYFMKPNNAVTKKHGSLQTFIPNAQDFTALPSRFIKSINPVLLHPIFLLDILVGNDDRHCRNLLWDGYKVVAIDNGFTLSSEQIRQDGWKWLEMPQTKAPVDMLLKKKILDLKSEKLPLDFDKSVHARVKERLTLLQVGLESGLTIFDIIGVMTASNMKNLLNLDKTLYERAQKMIQERKHAMERENFWPTF